MFLGALRGLSKGVNESQDKSLVLDVSSKRQGNVPSFVHLHSGTVLSTWIQ